MTPSAIRRLPAFDVEVAARLSKLPSQAGLRGARCEG